MQPLPLAPVHLLLGTDGGLWLFVKFLIISLSEVVYLSRFQIHLLKKGLWLKKKMFLSTLSPHQPTASAPWRPPMPPVSHVSFARYSRCTHVHNTYIWGYLYTCADL